MSAYEGKRKISRDLACISVMYHPSQKSISATAYKNLSTF